ncbi:hypothetical protein PUG42_27015 [Erwiniaceae bacterium L1_54_3]|nr:hypothetical protein [Erwiniaceae bacterium L1_54_3]
MKEKIDQAIKNAEIFFLGNKLPDDFYSAFIEWSRITEETDEPKAFYNLAYCYKNGEGINKNLQKAIDNYIIALDKGIKEAADQLYLIFGKETLERKIILFNKTTSLVESEKYQKDTQVLLNIVSKFIKRGLNKFEAVKIALNDMLSVLDLHIAFLRNDEEFKSTCEYQKKNNGIHWATDLYKISHCRMQKVFLYQESRESREVIVNGSTAYAKGAKFYKVLETLYFINSTQETVKLYYPSPKEFAPGDREREYNWISNDFISKEIKPPAQYTSFHTVNFIQLHQINSALGFKSAVDIIKPWLPVDVINETKELPVSTLNKVGLFILAMIALVVLFLVTR